MKLFYTLLLSIFISFHTSADTFDDIAVTIKQASSKELSKFLNSSVELTITSTEGVYSKVQAEQMIKSFFEQNAPKNVIINHRGSSSQGSKYAIATMETAQGKFRIYIFMKNAGQGLLIHELKFEKE
jgi:hypothetical protein